MKTYELPAQPDGPLWDRDGDKWVKPNGEEYAFAVEDSWLRQVKGKDSLCVIWVDLLDEYGPLTDTPPATGYKRVRRFIGAITVRPFGEFFESWRFAHRNCKRNGASEW